VRAAFNPPGEAGGASHEPALRGMTGSGFIDRRFCGNFRIRSMGRSASGSLLAHMAIVPQL